MHPHRVLVVGRADELPRDAGIAALVPLGGRIDQEHLGPRIGCKTCGGRAGAAEAQNDHIVGGVPVCAVRE
ncbi:hypothetical protein SDC9_114495 [bioreactor metagenome]|uniref:Uncharacterized protein n=1 Tax=bioreactor metagenome TaxID=1076179 RepID=A0A645BQT8_9ZZZZ